MAASLITGLISLFAAAFVTSHRLAPWVHRMVPLSAGLLIATSLLHLLPESLELGLSAHGLGTTLLVGLIGLFLLERLSVVRHDHHHEHDGHDHPAGHDRKVAGRGGLAILVGDGIHNFADGLVIATAFSVNQEVGWLTALAIAVHEIPQEIGDFIVLLNAGYSKARALVFNALVSLTSVLGGIVGYYSLGAANDIRPIAIALAASIFIYIALSDLVPQMHADRDSPARNQLGLLGVGVAIVVGLTHFVLHVH